MSQVERSIISLIEPDFNVIRLEKLRLDDRSNTKESKEGKNENPNDPDAPYRTSTENVGLLIPWVSINSMILFDDELSGFELDCSDKIPTLFIKFKDTKNRLAIDSPLDAGFICVYIKPPDWEEQRPIRLDFTITKMDGNPKSRTYTVNGILKLPKFFEEVCQAFPQGTSFEHLKKMCQDIGIGYASNEDSTDDSMVRFIPFENFEYFVNNTVATAYKDDKSFFDWYIDPWYNLCFVNVNKQFSLEDKFEEVRATIWPPISTANYAGGFKDTLAEKMKMVITNAPPQNSTNFGIVNYLFNNNSGDVVIKNGYKRTGYWLNIDGKAIESQNAYSEALTTEGANDKYILLKGLKKEDGTAYDYRQKNKHTWLGKQSVVENKGNVHPNFAFSKILNHQNLEELSKTNLQLTLKGPNFHIYKYQRIPVVIYEAGSMEIKDYLRQRDEFFQETKPLPENDLAKNYVVDPDNPGITQDDDRYQVINNFLSGYYLIGGIKYTYVKSMGYIQPELTLIRREWPIPAKNSIK